MLKNFDEASLNTAREKDCNHLLKDQKRVLERVTILFSISSYINPPHSEVQVAQCKETVLS